MMQDSADTSATVSSESLTDCDEQTSLLASMLDKLVVAVHETFMMMRREQQSYSGSVCSKRLQDRIQRAFPTEYAVIVDGMYDRSWDTYLRERAGILCFPQMGDDPRVNIGWMLAPGSLRCHLSTEDVSSVKDADELLGRLVRDKCCGELERTCRTILLEVFCVISRQRFVEGSTHQQSPGAEYEVGSLMMWESILNILWLQRIEGREVRLRELERPCQQLGFHIRLRCRWVELLGNNLLSKYVYICMLRVFLNVEGPEMRPSAGNSHERPRGTLVVKFVGSLGEYIVSMDKTRMWGRIPSTPGHYFL